MPRKSLTEHIETSNASLTARTIIYDHRFEIQEQLKRGVSLRIIRQHLIEMYKEEIKQGNINMSEPYFYQLWRDIRSKIEKPPAASPPAAIVDQNESKPPVPKFDNTAGKKGASEYDWNKD